MVLGVPGFCPLRGAAGVEGTWRGCALQVTSCQPPVPEGMRGASVPESAVGCEERSLQRDGGCDPK